ncbi:capsule biosynthesis protein [Stappia sp. ES.058]|uniref:capsule biosynthesis protein n=1 Tax=Stappia sp. ES.058 TaxID=1881061 RepID=UPI00087B7287|nr:capsular biosynthesis protein [Stappia sp. ES.058]SDU02232.1 capsular polysaccharide export protein [Stappia sp. ES.058]
MTEEPNREVDSVSGAGRSNDAARVVLFLQGPPSGFPRCVADELEALGHKTLRINLSLSDWFLWHDSRCVNFRGHLSEWPAYLERHLIRHGVTDIVFYQDRFPYHSVAVEIAGRLGVRAVAYENGYLRPDWITAELDGMSVRSLFPDDVDAIRAAAADLPPVDMTERYRHPFWQEAMHEVVCNLLNAFDLLAFPRFVADKFYHPLFEYVMTLPRLLFARRRDRVATILIDDLVESNCPVFVFPLQMQSDYQLRYNAKYDHLADALEEVFASFSAHAHPAAQLVVKLHPMDQGIEPWRRIVRRLARRHGIKRRVHLVDGGHLVTLLKHASGAVMVNSTTGLHAVKVGCPVKVLGVAVYDLPGLTCQLPLDRFWRIPQAPDPETYQSVQRLMGHAIQIQGNFHSRDGMTAAARELAARIAGGLVNVPGCVDRPAPRIERARALGVPVTVAEEIAARGKTGRWKRAWRG